MYPFFKRLLDLGIAIFAFVVLSPILIPSMVILAFTGEKEVFYLQDRVGFKNKLFKIWKFATMMKNSANIGTGAITVRNDPRVTKYGSLLRRTKINELPQIFNVIKGDMSIVGPRPLMQVSFDLYNQHVRDHIYNSKPGITGIGSLVFRDEEKLVSDAADPKEMYERVIYPHKGDLELWYQKNKSMWTDILIIFLTAWVILFSQSDLVNRVFHDLPKRNF
jgi:lipopolysaccharide/colanic/teichoic acid biosynthesis glycosyltransferase